MICVLPVISAASVLGAWTDQVDVAPAVHDAHVLPPVLPLLPLGPASAAELPRGPGPHLGPLTRDPHLELGVVLSRALALPHAAKRGAVAAALAARVFLVRGVVGQLGLGQGGWRLAAQDGEAAGGVGVLHALLGGVLLCGGGGLVPLDAGDVVCIVDVPGLLAQEVAAEGRGLSVIWGARVAVGSEGGREKLTEAWLLVLPGFSLAGKVSLLMVDEELGG